MKELKRQAGKWPKDCYWKRKGNEEQNESQRVELGRRT